MVETTGPKPHLGVGTGNTSFITGMSAACVQKQSCTETKVRPFLAREIPCEAAATGYCPSTCAMRDPQHIQVPQCSKQ